MEKEPGLERKRQPVYKIVADDGTGNVVEINMSGGDLFRMAERSIIDGIHASMSIEGEGLKESQLDLLSELQLRDPKIILEYLKRIAIKKST